MSKEARQWAEKQRIADHTLTTVLRSVAWGSDKGTGLCRKAQADLVTEARLSLRALQYSLAVLAKLEVIQRKPRSKGKYGRTTDLVILPLDRNFDISKAAIEAVRKSLRSPLQNARGAVSAKSCNMHEVRLQHARGAGEYNPVNPEESLSVGELSKGREGTYEGRGADELHSLTRTELASNVVELRLRGNR